MRVRALLLLLPSALLLLACGPSEDSRQLAEGEMKSALEVYLPALARAYATGDLEPLAGLAAEKEIAGVEKRIQDLRDQGRNLEPTFRELTIEDAQVWNYANAFVTTVEVWDLRVTATGSGQQLGEELGRRQRVKYQLKRDQDRWLVLFRAVQE